MKLEQAFGQILREYRKKANLSQEKLAQESDLDRTYISLLERGLRQPSITTVFQLSTALKISSTEIISALEAMFNEDPENRISDPKR
ncbi:MAG: helix-turn-helix transcriptional regulator [Deltaproteobacteria bacterium]|jgi:transcriptional regulator with XRE-family HTH domain|nr:helix-turn-helix transcriptional regulator [Deltaproteobacteria bacterium]